MKNIQDRYLKWKLSKMEALGIFLRNTLNICKYYLKYFKYKNTLSNNEQLENKFRKKECIIMGNGPSIREMDLSKLKGKHIFGVNEFLLNHLHKKIIPNFYCCMDPDYWLDQLEENKMIEMINKNPKTIFFTSIDAKDSIEKKIVNNNVYYIAPFITLYDEYNKKIDISTIMPRATNVIVYSIMIAVYLGFTDICLIGCDFNSFATPKTQHFYDDKEEGVDRHMSMEFELRAYSQVCREHRILKNYYDKKGIKIVNATPNSLLDVYQKISIDNII